MRTRSEPAPGKRKVLYVGEMNLWSLQESDRLTDAGHLVDVYEWKGDWSLDSANELALAERDVIIVEGDMLLCNNILRDSRVPVILRWRGGQDSVESTAWNCGILNTVIKSRKNFRVAASLNTFAMKECLATLSQAAYDEELMSVHNSWGLLPRKRSDVLLLSPHSYGDTPYQQRAMRSVQELDSLGKFVLVSSHLTAAPPCEDLGRSKRLQCLSRAAGLLYPYVDPHVVYAPAFEMLCIGGPIVYFRESLLCGMLGQGGPGEARDIQEAMHLCRALARGDTALANAMIAFQQHLQQAMLPKVAWPQFDAAMEELLNMQLHVDFPKADVCEGALQAQRLALDIITSCDPEALKDPNVAQQIIKTVYNVFLQRSPEESGLQGYTEKLLREHDIGSIIKEIILSTEAQQKQHANIFLSWLRAHSAS